MSSASSGGPVRIVKMQLGRDAVAAVTCIDVTPPGARVARMLEVSTLQVHKIPMDTARAAASITYDAGQMATILFRVSQQYDAARTAYARDTVQQVTQALTNLVNKVAPPEDVSSRSRRRLYADL
jgi:hypothetical protein